MRKNPTRRNLFGPVDREQLQADCQDALRKDLEDASQRWGFDFILDKPLESSNFQWEGIPGSSVPQLYRPSMFDLEQPGERAAKATVSPKRGRVGPPGSEKENIPKAFDLESLDKTQERRENTALKRKQTNITDFYQSKRRVVQKPRKSGQ